MHQTHKFQRLTALVALALVCTMPLAEPDPCVDAKAQLETVSALGKRHAELASAQNSEWDRYTKALNEKASARGWTDAKKREVMLAPLSSEEYLADEIKKRPYQMKLESWMNQLKLAEETNDLRAACLSTKEAWEASDRFIEVHLRQYKLALKMLTEE
jgi:hypothetical protein